MGGFVRTKPARFNSARRFLVRVRDAMNGGPGKRTGTYRIDNDNDDNDDDKGTLLLNGQTRTSLTMALAPFEMPALISRLKTSSRLVAALSPSSPLLPPPFYTGRNRVLRSIDRIERPGVGRSRDARYAREKRNAPSRSTESDGR